MRKILLTFVALAAVFAPTVLAEVEKDEGVLVLTEANFDATLSQYENLLVEFYAPWCGHCKKLAPEYAAAAATLAAQDPPQYIAKVDATENNALAERFEVKGFPTLIFFRNGQKQDYTGGRTKDTIVNWINKKTGPASVEVSCDDLSAKVAGNKLNMVYFGAFEGAFYQAYLSAAGGDETYAFYHAAGACAATHGAKSHGISIFRTFDDSPVHFDGEQTSAAIMAWGEASAIPMLIEFSEDYIEPIFGKGRDALILFTDDRSGAYNEVFAQAAKQMTGQILFVVSGTKDGIQQRLAEFVGVDSSSQPTLRLLAPGEEMKKYVYSGELSTVSVHSLQNFVTEFKSGALKPHLKSEAEPEEQGAVTILVGTNYDRIVNDPTKDVLVKFYAPWCGHCKALAPVWDELGEHVSAVNDLVIAKFDATANEVDGVSIRGYPTLKFYPKSDKSGRDYEGDRDLAAFQDWLNNNSSAYRNHFSRNEEL